MKENSYVICKSKEQSEKPFLARIKKSGEKSLVVTPEKDIQYGRKDVVVKRSEVKVLLGDNPFPGTVYGIDLHNLYRKTIEHEFWGPIHFFIHPEKETRILLKRGLDSTAKRIDQLGLSPFTNTFETEIRAKKGKYAGMYKHSGSDKRPNAIWYAPDWCSGDQKSMDYVIYHEFGHAVRYNGLKTNKMRNKWLRLYQSTIEQVKVERKTLEGILADMEDYDETQESFRGAFNGATQDLSPRVGKAITQWLKESHKIGTQELEIMWRSTKLKDIRKFWPDHMIDTHDLKPRLTEYATKNVEETFAETFAFYCQRKKLPSSFTELMEESLSVARVQGKELDND